MQLHQRVATAWMRCIDRSGGPQKKAKKKKIKLRHNWPRLETLPPRIPALQQHMGMNDVTRRHRSCTTSHFTRVKGDTKIKKMNKK